VLADAERSFAISEAAAQRAARSRALERADAFRRQVEGPAKRYVELTERAREMAEGPARRLIEMTEQARRASEGPVKQYLELAERARDVAAEPARRLAELIEQARITVEGPALRMREHYLRFNDLLERYDFAKVLEQAAAVGVAAEQALKQSLPANWCELTFDEAEEVEKLVREHGLPLVWVPGPDLTARLASSPTPADATRVLLEQQAAVLTDIEGVLDEVTQPQLGLLVSKTRKAVSALRGGHGDAAQALAAAVFTAALHEGLGHGELSDVREEAKLNSPDDAALSAYRRALVVHLAARYVQGRGYELPGFNRSTSLHRMEAVQYTPANHLAAIMAAAAVLREAQELYDATT
jgi:hypothetical protein